LGGRPFAETDTLKVAARRHRQRDRGRRFWAGRDPLQGRVKLTRITSSRCVAVVEDTKVSRLDEPAAPFFLYVPFAQSTGPFGLTRAALLVRTSGDVDALLPRLREQLHAADPDAPIAALTTFTWQVRKLAMPQRMGAVLFATFSLLAVTLAAIGIYGVTAYVGGAAAARARHPHRARRRSRAHPGARAAPGRSPDRRGPGHRSAPRGPGQPPRGRVPARRPAARPADLHRRRRAAGGDRAHRDLDPRPPRVTPRSDPGHSGRID
jgi:hypothetical protein